MVGSVYRKRSIWATVGIVSTLTLSLAAVAPASTVSAHRSTLKFQKNGLPNLRGITLNLEHTGSSPHVGDTISYLQDQLLLQWGATGSYSIGQTPIFLNVPAGRDQAIGGNWESAFNVGLKCFGPAQPGQSYTFVTNPTITSGTQLSGKIVAVSQLGSGTDLLLNALLKKYHVSRSSLQIEALDAAPALAAFIAGRVNGYWAETGDTQVLTQQHIPYRVMASADSVAPYEADSYECATPAWLQQNPSLAEAIDLAWLYAARIMVKNPNEWDSYATKYTQGVLPLNSIKVDWAQLVNQHDFPDGPRAFEKKYVVLNYKDDVIAGSISNRSANAPVGNYVEFGPWNEALNYFEAHKNLVK